MNHADSSQINIDRIFANTINYLSNFYQVCSQIIVQQQAKINELENKLMEGQNEADG